MLNERTFMTKLIRSGFQLKAMIACASLALFVLPGCVGYRLGSMLPADINSVFIPTIVNATGEPNVESDITQALIEEFQQDGSLKVLNDEAQADSVLNVKLISYSLQPLDYDSVQETRANEYRLRLIARVSLIRSSTGEVIAERPNVRGDTDFFFSGDLTTTKRQQLPAAAEDLAHDIVEIIVEAWE